MTDLIPTIGEDVPETALVVYRGVALEFDIEWTDDSGDPVVIESYDGAIKDDNGEVLVDFAEHSTSDVNVISIRVPGDALDWEGVLAPRWYLAALSDNGDDKVLGWGPVRMREAR